MKFYILGFVFLILSCSDKRDKGYGEFTINNVTRSYQINLKSQCTFGNTFHLILNGELDGDCEIMISTPNRPEAMIVAKKNLKAGKHSNVILGSDLWEDEVVLFKYNPINVKTGNINVIWKSN